MKPNEKAVELSNKLSEVINQSGVSFAVVQLALHRLEKIQEFKRRNLLDSAIVQEDPEVDQSLKYSLIGLEFARNSSTKE